jgi:hypothetical protein
MTTTDAIAKTAYRRRVSVSHRQHIYSLLFSGTLLRATQRGQCCASYPTGVAGVFGLVRDVIEVLTLTSARRITRNLTIYVLTVTEHGSSVGA